MVKAQQGETAICDGLAVSLVATLVLGPLADGVVRMDIAVLALAAAVICDLLALQVG